MRNIEEYRSCISALKEVNRRLLTNDFYSEEDHESWIEKDLLEDEYEEGSYLNLFLKEESFTRVFYSVADLSEYQIKNSEDTLILDQYVPKEDDPVFKEKMELSGFKQYRIFHKYTASDFHSSLSCPEGYSLFKESTEEVYSLIKKHFDPCTDMIPATYADFKDHYQMISYTNEEGKLCGFVVYIPKGNTISIEYLYVSGSERGKRLSYCLYGDMIKENPDARKYICWIADDNDASIHTNIKCGFKEEKYHKITWRRN